MTEFPFLKISNYLGLFATVVLTFNILLGMLLGTAYKKHNFWKMLPDRIKQISILNLHNWTAYIALTLVLLHPLILLFDPATKFKFVDIIFPINAPHQKLFVALGTLAMFAIITVIITTQKAIKKKMSFRTWKNIHLISYGTAILFFFHGILIDPQLKDRPVEIFDAEKIVSELCLLILIAVTIFRIRYEIKSRRSIKKFHSIQISEVVVETKDSKSFVLNIPEKLKKQFAYTAGQFIIIKLMIDGKEYKRSYSISASPYTDENFQITVKRIKDGTVSNFLNDNLKTGDKLLVFPPSGNFFKEPQQNVRKNYILFAGGSGITPIYSIIKTLLTQPPFSFVKLIYANRNPDAIIFYTALETLKNSHSKSFFLTHIVSDASAGWNGMTGQLNSDNIKIFLEEQQNFIIENTEYYICGPSPFMELVEHELQNHGVANEQLHLERFISIGDSSQPIIIGKDDAEINLKESNVSATVDGKENKVTCSNDETILDALLNAGVDAPYSCKEGICSSCIAKLVKGKVKMLNAQSLSDIDMKENRILTCQATCLTKDVEINYDNL